MFDNLHFHLKGTAYLCDLIHQDGSYVAKLNVIHRFNSGTKHTDDIWISCTIDNERLLNVVTALKRSLDMGKTIIMAFEMQYTSFEHCHLPVSNDDSNTIIFLKGRLVEIGKYLVNGVNPIKDISDLHNRFLESAINK